MPGLTSTMPCCAMVRAMTSGSWPKNSKRCALGCSLASPKLTFGITGLDLCQGVSVRPAAYLAETLTIARFPNAVRRCVRDKDDHLRRVPSPLDICEAGRQTRRDSLRPVTTSGGYTGVSEQYDHCYWCLRTHRRES